MRERDGGLRGGANVGEVGGGAEAIAGDLLRPVGDGDSVEAGAKQLDSSAGGGIDAMNLDARAGRVAVFLAKGVFEDTFDAVCSFLIGVDRQVVMPTKAERTQIVEAHHMVGVAMGVEHSVDAANPFAQGLGGEVGACIHEDGGGGGGDAGG